MKNNVSNEQGWSRFVQTWGWCVCVCVVTVVVITHSWAVPRSKLCCCTSPPLGPSVRSRRWSTPGLPASEWSDTLGCWCGRGLLGLATRTPSGSRLHAWGEEFITVICRAFFLNTSAASQLLYSLLTEVVDSLPVVLVHSKPLAVTWPDVDVDWAEVVVLLVSCRLVQASVQSFHTIICHWSRIRAAARPHVWEPLTWRAAAGHLHVQLDRVHAQYGVAYVAEHVVAGLHTHERWQLEQLLQLGLPPDHQRNRRAWSNKATWWVWVAGLESKLHLLGSERSMLVPNLMIFPTDFWSGLEKGIMSENMVNENKNTLGNFQMDSVYSNLGVMEALFGVGAALLLLSLRPAFAVFEVSEDCSPSSSFSLSFSSCNTSTWA